MGDGRDGARSEGPPANADVSTAHGVTLEHLRRFGDTYSDLGDPTIMTRAWRLMPARRHRSFGQLPGMHVPDDFDAPLPETEIAAWQDNSST
jgi:hypothetical protein